MAPSSLLERLRSDGFSIRYEESEDRLYVGPSDALTSELISAVKEHKDALIDLLEQEAAREKLEGQKAKEEAHWNAVMDAIAARAFSDPPPFPEDHSQDAIPYVLRESTLVTFPGMAPVASSPAFVAWWEEWNRVTQEWHDKAQRVVVEPAEQEKTKTAGKKGGKARGKTRKARNQQQTQTRVIDDANPADQL